MNSKWIFRYRTAILVTASIVTIGGAIFGFGAIGTLSTQGFDAKHSEAKKIEELCVDKFVSPIPDYFAILEHDHWLVNQTEFIDAYYQFKDAVKTLPVRSIVSAFDHPTTADALISNDGTKAMVTIRRKDEHHGKILLAHDFKKAVHGNPLKITFSGKRMIEEEVSEVILEDLARAETFTLPVVCVVMVLAFQGVVATGPALAVAIFTIVWSLVSIRLVNYATPMSEFAVNVITLMGLGVSVDYSMFIILRFREEKEKFPNQDLVVLMNQVLNTSGRTVMFSAVTVALSLTGTFFFDEYYVYSMGFAIILVVIFASISSSILLPAILFVLNDKIFLLSTKEMSTAVCKRYSESRLRHLCSSQKCATKKIVRSPIEKNESSATQSIESIPVETTPVDVKNPAPALSDGIWYRLTMFTMKYATPLCIAIVAGLVGLLYVFVSEVQVASPTPMILPKSEDARYAYEITQKEFTTAGKTSLVVYLHTVEKLGVWDPQFLIQLDDFVSSVENLEHVTEVSCLVRFGLGKNVTNYLIAYAPYQTEPDKSSSLFDPFYLTNMDDIALVSISISSTKFTKSADRVLNNIRDLLDKSFYDDNGDRSIDESGVTGESALNHDMFQDVWEQLPKWLAVMMVSIYILLLLMTGSVFLPLKAIASAVLSLSASLGVLVLVFQRGNGEDVLEFTSTGQIDGLQLIFIFSLAFGLSMDYELFIVGRIQEFYEYSKNTRVSVASGLQSTARAVTMAAIVLAVVMGAFVSSRTTILKLIGVGVSLSIVVDATIVRVILVPGMMELMGSLNWWAPSWITRLVDRLNLKERSDGIVSTVIVDSGLQDQL
eukprot:c9898_g1_i1.p1 GENE.c9898_g1_i1~~c9898_g1_i1.p1  ORF type:complete len:830 (-),score=202.40 c9898_g1_i1:166-2655(-)